MKSRIKKKSNIVNKKNQSLENKDIKKIFSFLMEVKKLKGKKRRGWEIHKIKNPETTAEHIFHLVFLVWLLGGGKKINLDRAIKMALIHDICEVYSIDLTSYDAASIKDNDKLTIKNIFEIKPKKGRPTIKQRKKMEKIKKKMEAMAMKKILKKLPDALAQEINDLWVDYEKEISAESRFVKQADKFINFLQGMDYWKDYGKIEHNLWNRRIKEVLDDPLLLSLIKESEKFFYKK